MINFAVINLKSAIKNLIKIIIVLLLIIGIVNLSNLIKCFNFEISYIDLVKNNISLEFKQSTDNIQKILSSEIPMLATSQEVITETDEAVEDNNIRDVEMSNETEETSSQSNEDNLNSDEDLKNLTTTVISSNNISESYNTIYENVKIKNESSYTLTEDILTPNVEFSNKTDIVIFHTHTCESYTATEENNYVASRKL